jgi:hypothetical protein
MRPESVVFFNSFSQFIHHSSYAVGNEITTRIELVAEGAVPHDLFAGIVWPWGIWVFRFLGFDEQIECLFCIDFGLGLPDVVQRGLGFWLLAFG